MEGDSRKQTMFSKSPGHPPLAQAARRLWSPVPGNEPLENTIVISPGYAT